MPALNCSCWFLSSSSKTRTDSARNQDVRVALLGDGERLLDGVRGDRPDDFRQTGQSGSDHHADGRELQTHFVYLLARAFLAPGIARDFSPYISSCKRARLRTHSALATLGAAARQAQLLRLKRPNLCLCSK